MGNFKENYTKIFGKDVPIASTSNEKDAIDSINKGKANRLNGDRSGADSADSPSVTTGGSNVAPPTVVKGNDSAETPTTEETTDSTPVESQPTPTPAQQNNFFDASSFASLIGKAVGDAIAPINQKLTETQEKLKTTEDTISNLFSNTGKPNPVQAPMTNLTTGIGDGIKGSVAELHQILSDRDSTPAINYYDHIRGTIYPQRDMRSALEFFRENRSKLRNDMQSFARHHGLIRGFRDMNVGSDAATAKADIPDLLLDYLSMVVRETHEQTFIYWQFTMNRLELGKGDGDTIRVPRFNFLNEPATTTDRELTPGVSTTSNRQPITESAVAISLKERGLGKGANAEPVAIPEFWLAYSMGDLEGAVTRVLGHDANADQDLMIRSLFFQTTKVLYNDNGEVTSTLGDLAANDNGTCTNRFLNAVSARMFSDKVIPYSNGKFGLVLPPRPLQQLKNDLQVNNRYIERSDIADVTAALNVDGNDKRGGVVSGYVGDVGDFMIFTTNAHSVGAAGTSGVQNETIAASPRTTRTSFAFGAAAVGEATGMDVEIRNGSADFGRGTEWIWIAHKGYGHLDTDSGISAAQQTRVYQLRTTDVAF